MNPWQSVDFWVLMAVVFVVFPILSAMVREFIRQLLGKETISQKVFQSIPEVELHDALVFICENCSKDTFIRLDMLEMTPEQIQESFGDALVTSDARFHTFQKPTEFRCVHCGQLHCSYPSDNSLDPISEEGGEFT